MDNAIIIALGVLVVYCIIGATVNTIKVIRLQRKIDQLKKDMIAESQLIDELKKESYKMISSTECIGDIPKIIDEHEFRKQKTEQILKGIK